LSFFLSVFFLAYFLLAAARVFSPCLSFGLIQPQVAHIIYPLVLALLLDLYQILVDLFSYRIRMLHTWSFSCLSIFCCFCSNLFWLFYKLLTSLIAFCFGTIGSSLL
jgi:hypothetical protein